MARSIALLSGVFAVAAAQTTTLSLYMPMFDPQGLHASVVGVKGDATTLALACPSGTDSSDCGFGNQGPIIAGESTFAFAFTMDTYDGEIQAVATNAYACNMTPSNYAVTCTMTMSASSGTFSDSSSTVVSTKGNKSEYEAVIIPVTVTAGANKLGDNSSPASTTGVSKPTNTASDAENTDSGSASASATASDATPDAASTPTESDNAAGPMMTKNAVLAGVAAVVGGAMLM